jgi:hypothetical protein
MNSSESADAIRLEVDRELRLVTDAISMVAGGASPRVTVAGLSLSDQVLEPARRLARQAGVRIVPQWSADESGVDITVERVASPETERE